MSLPASLREQFPTAAVPVPKMSDQHFDERRESADEPDQRVGGADVLAILAVASFLAAIGLITFFVTSALAS